MTLTTSLLFETPLIVHELAKSAELAAELVRLAATRRASDNSGQPWETDSRMLRWAGDPAIQLLEGCVEIADRYTVDIDVPEGRTRYGWWADLRAQFPGAEGRLEARCFPSAYWSVLLSARGDGDVRIILEDPRMPMIAMEDPGLRVRMSPAGDILEAEHEFSLQEGQVAMFPAWLRRRVEFSSDARQRGLLTLNLFAFLASDPAGASDAA